MSEKIFLKLNLDFIVAGIRGVFGSVGVYAFGSGLHPLTRPPFPKFLDPLLNTY